MKYTIYQTTNKINGKIYIGFHITENPEDDYLGSGYLLKKAITKYGVEAFEKEVLFVFDNPEEMFEKEAELVNEEFLARPDIYNIKLGGQGGWDYINKNGFNRKRGPVSKETREKISGSLKNRKNPIMSQLHKMGKIRYNTFSGKSHSDDAKKRIGEANKKLIGDRNGAFGTCWVTNGKESKRIPKESLMQYELQGFRKGRIIQK